MTFFKHTENWFKGESVEAWMLVLFGSALVLLAIFFWKFGHGPTTRVMILPFLVVGLLISLGAGAGLLRNPSRLAAMRAEAEKDSAAFVQSEKERVEGFQTWYKPLLITWTVGSVSSRATIISWFPERKNNSLPSLDQVGLFPPPFEICHFPSSTFGKGRTNTSVRPCSSEE